LGVEGDAASPAMVPRSGWVNVCVWVSDDILDGRIALERERHRVGRRDREKEVFSLERFPGSN
jgi:hypothetical protein